MSRKGVYILSATLIAICSTTSAQIELTLEKCRAMALDYSRNIKIAENREEQALIQNKIARAAQLPTLKGSGIYYYSPNDIEYSATADITPPIETGIPQQDELAQIISAMIPDFDIAIETRGVMLGGVNVEQPVYTGGKIRASKRMTQTGIDIAQTSKELSRTEVITEADEAFYKFESMKAKVEAAKEYKKVVDELIITIEAAKKEGMVTRTDLLKTRVKQNEASLMIQKAKSGRELSRMNLCRIIGEPFTTEITIVQTQENLSNLHQALPNNNNSVEKRPEYKLLEKSLKIQDHKIEIARAGMLPQIGISAGYNYFGGLKINDQSNDEMIFSAMASISIPIFNWFEQRNSLTRAELEKKERELNKEESVKLLQLEIAQAQFNYKDALTRKELTEAALEEAKENMKTSQQRYDEGLERLENLLEAQAQWQEAISNNIEAKNSVKTAHTKYLKATGQL
ncbi:TolC family protein [Marinilabiliaceae bacterium ANBcel2]|nr:TolC family protein [Marinilabiliaceae bacterium ANBcel2]